MGAVAHAEAPRPPARASGASARSARVLLGAIGAALVLSLLADAHVSRPDAANTDVHVQADGDVSVVLCVVDESSLGRCIGKDAVLSGTLDGATPALCGMAARSLASPCPAGQPCAFRRAAAPSGAIGLVVLEPRPPLFGVPRHRLIDAAVLAHGAASGTAEIAAGVRALARCFAPSGARLDRQLDVARSRDDCEQRACRLQRSRVRVATRGSVAGLW